MYRDDMAIYKIHSDYHAEFTLNIVNVLVMTRKTDCFALGLKPSARNDEKSAGNDKDTLLSKQKRREVA